MDMTLTHALFIKHKTVQHVIFSNNLQNLNFQLQQASKYSLKFQPQQAIKHFKSYLKTPNIFHTHISNHLKSHKHYCHIST
jgi:hypothetical protein